MDKITEIQLNNTPKAELQNLVSCADDDFKLLLDNNPLFETLVNVLVSADLSANIKRSLVVKIVDDVWISTIENALPALDKVLRRPSRFIVEQDKVLPIEQSKNITARSIRDLAQHSDYIKDVSDGNVVPSKILNVFREETIRTYENRFVNTLVHRLFDFINKRYRRAQQLSMDEKKTELDLSSEFSSGKLRGIINLNIQLLEPPIASELNQKDIFDENKWERVEKIYGIARDYIGSEFIKSMGNDFVRPPIMRTNAILKNPDLRQCLALWEFVESYDDMGYYSISTESTTPASDKLISDMAKAMSLQLAYLRWATVDDALNVKGNIMQDKPKEKQSKSVTPSFDKRGVASGAVADDAVDEQEQKRILDAIAVCIDISREQMEKKLKDLLQQKKFDFADKAKYRWSFYARLVTLGEIVQQKYGAIKNYLLSFNNVRSRFSIDGETFYYKRNKLAKMTVKGKTLVLHLALSPLDERLSKYHVYDSSDVAKYQDVPCTTKIKSDRAVKYAKLMIDLLMQDKDVQLGEVQNVDYMLPSLTFEQLLDECLVKLIGSDSPLYAQPHNQQAEQTQEGDEDLPDEDEDDVDDDDEDDNDEQEQLLLPDDDSPFARRMYRWSFYARLVTLGAPVQQKYAEIKNHLLSYKKVRSSQAFDGETFYYKRVKLAKMIIKGKTLSVYFAKLPDGTDLGAIHYVDRSDVTKYKDIPCCLKVKSDRAVKHAKTFADLVMQNNGVVLGEVQNVDYSLAYQTVQQLIEQGWIKEVTRNLPTDGNTDNQRQDDRSEQLQNVASSLPLSRNMGLVYEPEWDKTTNGNNGASKAVSITPIYYGDMQNDIVTHHVAPQQPQQQSIDKYDAAHSFQEKALAVVEKTGHEQSKKKKEIVNAEVDYKWHINVADEGELFSKFPKEEIEKVLNKVRQHTVNYSINQVEGEIIVCYKTLAKMKWFKRRHYRKILNGNDVKAITSVLDKLMKKYLSDLK